MSLIYVSGSSPRNIFDVFLLLNILHLKAYMEIGRNEILVAHLPCICCKSQILDPLERSVILLNQNCASLWIWWNYTPLFDMTCFSSFLFWDMASIVFIFLWAFMCSLFFQYFGTFMCPIFSRLWDLHVPLFFQYFCMAFMSLLLGGTLGG